MLKMYEIIGFLCNEIDFKESGLWGDGIIWDV